MSCVDCEGGCDDLLTAYCQNTLMDLVSGEESYDYDLAVIGGGSGGLAAAKVDQGCACCWNSFRL